MITIVTSNPRKAEQFSSHFQGKPKVVIAPLNEIKEEIPEIVSFRKAEQYKILGGVFDDRALYLLGNLPGADIKAFIEDKQVFLRLFKGREGRLVYSFAYRSSDFIHVYSHNLRVKISNKVSNRNSAWGFLGKVLIVPPKIKPLAEYSSKEEQELEKRIKRLIFDPFIFALTNTPKPIKRSYWDSIRINKFFGTMRNGIMDRLKEHINFPEDSPNNLIVKKRVLLSLLYYPPSAFFKQKIEVLDNVVFKIPKPTGKLLSSGKEVIEKLIDYHSNKIRKTRLPKITKEIEDQEKTKSFGKAIERNRKIYIKRDNGEREEVKFIEYYNYELVNKLIGKFHYLSSPREYYKAYALIDKEERPLAIAVLSKVERRYKRKVLEFEGIREAIEVSRAYNSIWKVKGVLGMLLKNIKEKENKILLTAYQPNISNGGVFYGNGFYPYIVKPQQNFFIFDKEIPIFITRRNIGTKKAVRGKMPLLPSMEMISYPSRWIHFTDKLLP